MEIYENLKLESLGGEIWKDIEGYNGDYQISNLGRIKSFIRWHGTDVRILKQCRDGDGYLHIRLYKNRKGKTKKIYKLEFETFNKYKLRKDEVVHHRDGIKNNNILENFKLMTNSEHHIFHNSGENNPKGMLGKKHSEESKKLMKEKRIGKYSGENSSNVKLKEQDVIEIKKSYLPQKELAKMFGVHQTTISKIKTGRIWKHI